MYRLAKSYFDVGEYKRAAYIVRDVTSDLCYFLKVYSQYLAALQKHRHENINNHSKSKAVLGLLEWLTKEELQNTDNYSVKKVAKLALKTLELAIFE